MKRLLGQALGGNRNMHRSKFLCKITDQDDNVYMVRWRDLYHFIRRLNCKHCSAQLPATNSEKETT